MLYTVDWSTGFIGGRAKVYVGTSDKPLTDRIKEAISKLQGIPESKIKIIKKTKVKGSKSFNFGIGQPQSARDY